MTKQQINIAIDVTLIAAIVVCIGTIFISLFGDGVDRTSLVLSHVAIPFLLTHFHRNKT